MQSVGSFKTKVALGDYVSNWIKGLTLPVVFEAETEEFQFLQELLKGHPNVDDKVSGGLTAFRVQKNAFGNGAGMYLRMDNGQWLDFSWRKCISQARTNQKQKLLQAMRSAIRVQIRIFQERLIDLQCAKCGSFPTDFQIDHIISFIKLANEFLASETELPQIFVEDPETHLKKFHSDNQDFSVRWEVFHLYHAKLQLLCIDCHKAKTKEQLSKPRVTENATH